jgi:hypothetical protein
MWCAPHHRGVAAPKVAAQHHTLARTGFRPHARGAPARLTRAPCPSQRVVLRPKRAQHSRRTLLCARVVARAAQQQEHAACRWHPATRCGTCGWLEAARRHRQSKVQQTADARLAPVHILHLVCTRHIAGQQWQAACGAPAHERTTPVLRDPRASLACLMRCVDSRRRGGRQGACWHGEHASGIMDRGKPARDRPHARAHSTQKQPRTGCVCTHRQLCITHTSTDSSCSGRRQCFSMQPCVERARSPVARLTSSHV